MKRFIKKIITGILIFGGLTVGATTIPIIPTQIECQSAGNETQFSTSDGYLAQGEWANAEQGYKWVNENGGVIKQPDTYDTSKLTEVSVVGMRYWRICNDKGKLVKDTQITASEYNSLGTANGIQRGVLSPILEIPIANAAIANDATTSARNSTGSSLTVAFTCTNSNTYFVVTTNAQDSNHANLPVTSITYNAQSLSKIRSDEAVGNNRTEIWTFKPSTNCDGSSHNVVGNTTGSVGEFQEYVATYTGVDQTTPADANNGATGNSSTASDSITTVADNAWIVSQGSSEANFTGNGTGQTTNSTLTDQSFENGRQTWEGPKTPAGADTQSFSLGFGASWAISSISLTPATGGGTTPVLQDDGQWFMLFN